MAENQEPTTQKNTVTIEEAGPCKKKVIIEIPEETIKTVTDDQYNELAKDAIVPGFRKGRAPRRLLEKRLGKEVSEQIKLKLLADASESAIKDNEINILRDPDIDYENTELPESGSMKFEFEVEVRPEFELPELEGIEVNKPKLVVEDEQVEREIEQMRKWSGVWALRESGSVEVDDQIIADAILDVEGEEEEEKLDNIEIFARPNGFVGAIPVENLDKILLGAKAGDVKETEIEVPKTYFREEYRGKKVGVKITVKDIKWLKPCDLDENFFKKLGLEDENDLQQKVHENLQNRLKQQARQEMSSQIYKYMLENIDFELPVDVVAEQAKTILQRQYTNLLRQGLAHEQLEEQIKELQASSAQQAKDQLKTFFIMDKVAEKLDVSVSEEEVNGQIAQMAIQQGQRPEKAKEEMTRNGSLAQFSLQLREEKCIEKLLESAKISEIKAEKLAKKAKKAAKSAKKSEKTEKTVKKTTKKAVKKTAKKTAASEKTETKKTSKKKSEKKK